MPQWNCSCGNCQDARAGRIRPRTQSCVAVGDDLGNWYLVNASPDLRAQIEANPFLQPRQDSPRNTPIKGVLLTNADLDHILGLYLLREGQRISLHAARAVRALLASPLGIAPILDAFCGIEWHEPPVGDFESLGGRKKDASRLLYRAIVLGTTPPRFAAGSGAGDYVVAYQFQNPRTRRRLLIAPDVPAAPPRLRTALAESDAILFDGTFWTEDELARVRPGSLGSTELGHLPINDGSLEILQGLPASIKVYFHVNNTNPVLSLDSAERRSVEAAGIMIGYDGFEFEL